MSGRVYTCRGGASARRPCQSVEEAVAGLTLYKYPRRGATFAVWEVWGPPAPGDAMWPPGASWQVAMPRVGITRGGLTGGDARGEPHPPARPGYLVDYISRDTCLRS